MGTSSIYKGHRDFKNTPETYFTFNGVTETATWNKAGRAVVKYIKENAKDFLIRAFNIYMTKLGGAENVLGLFNPTLQPYILLLYAFKGIKVAENEKLIKIIEIIKEVKSIVELSQKILSLLDFKSETKNEALNKIALLDFFQYLEIEYKDYDDLSKNFVNNSKKDFSQLLIKYVYRLFMAEFEYKFEESDCDITKLKQKRKDIYEHLEKTIKPIVAQYVQKLTEENFEKIALKVLERIQGIYDN